MKSLLVFALVATAFRLGEGCSDSSCTVVEGGARREVGPEGSKTTLGSSVQHQVGLSDNAAIAASIGHQQVTANGQTVTSLSKGLEGSFKHDLGVTGIKFNDKSMSNGNTMRETSLSHGFRPTDNLKLTGTAGLSSGTVGGVPVSGRNLGLTGEGLSSLGKTSFGLTDSLTKGPAGWSERSTGGSLRHDVPLGGASSVGASLQGLRTDTGFSSKGFGVHGAKDWGTPGVSTLDLNRNLGHSPFGSSRTDTVSLGHQIPLSSNSYVAPSVSRSWSHTPSGSSSSNAFGFNFGWKF